MAEGVTWRPDWAISPGEMLGEELEIRGLSQSDLARRMDRPIKTINEIVRGKAAITPDTALQLELALGITSTMWLSVESKYRTHLARTRALETFADHAGWARRFPVADLRKYGLVEETASSDGGLVAALLAYFGVSSVRAWEQQWGAAVASYRKSPSFRSDPDALAAWLRWGERRAVEADCEPFDRGNLRKLLEAIRPLTREEPFEDVLEELRDDLAGCGVALVLTPELSKTHVSGAARWLTADKAIVQLSLRHRRDDQFWFTLCHELSHLLERRRSDHVDEGDDLGDEEHRADQRARDALVPPKPYRAFADAGDLSPDAVRRFARSVEVAPGIVVGRLQRDGLVEHKKLNELKKPLNWRAR